MAHICICITKSEREGRKIGHITLMPNDSAELTRLCRAIGENFAKSTGT